MRSADQRFGMRGLLEDRSRGADHLDGDAERARLALVEGDASLAALELDDPGGGAHVRPRAGGPSRRRSPRRRAPAVPTWLRANAAFAHADGPAFVRARAARQT